MKVFLGGTCGGSKWRDELMVILREAGVEYYNPVHKNVKDRGEEDKKIELLERDSCDYVLFAISPEISGVYSIAEVVDDSNKRPNKTIYYVYPETSDNKYPMKDMIYSLQEVGELVVRNGGKYFKEFDDMVNFFKGANNKDRIAINAKSR